MRYCAICRRPATDRHHIYEGSRRQASERAGMVVWLCHDHHMAIHHDEAANLRMKQAAQREFEKTHTREEFMEIFHKSYI